MTADMWWGLEDPAGAVVAGTCTDGWDQANVQISVDGGETFSMLEGSHAYDFGCGYGMVYNGFDCLSAGGGLGGGFVKQTALANVRKMYELLSDDIDIIGVSCYFFIATSAFFRNK